MFSISDKKKHSHVALQIPLKNNNYCLATTSKILFFRLNYLEPNIQIALFSPYHSFV